MAASPPPPSPHVDRIAELLRATSRATSGEGPQLNRTEQLLSDKSESRSDWSRWLEREQLLRCDIQSHADTVSRPTEEEERESAEAARLSAARQELDWEEEALRKMKEEEQATGGAKAPHTDNRAPNTHNNCAADCASRKAEMLKRFEALDAKEIAVQLGRWKPEELKHQHTQLREEISRIREAALHRKNEPPASESPSRLREDGQKKAASPPLHRTGERGGQQPSAAQRECREEAAKAQAWYAKEEARKAQSAQKAQQLQRCQGELTPHVFAEQCKRILDLYGCYRHYKKCRMLTEARHSLRKLLDVPSHGTAAQVKRQYNTKMRRFHPDKCAPECKEVAVKAAQCINEAKLILLAHVGKH